MANTALAYPEGLVQAINLTEPELEQHIRLMAALKMFELGKISSGKAAELAGMSRLAFFDTCARYKVSIFNYPDEEIAVELESDLAVLSATTNQ